MNATPDPTVYVDPYPGMKGTDRVHVPCRKCGGDGLYHGPTNAIWKYKGLDNPWCFECGGSGNGSIKVSSARAAARAAANRSRKLRDEAPYREWLAAERAYHQMVEAEAAAYAEQARRDTLVTGFIGHLGRQMDERLCHRYLGIRAGRTSSYRARDRQGTQAVPRPGSDRIEKREAREAAGPALTAAGPTPVGAKHPRNALPRLEIQMSTTAMTHDEFGNCLHVETEQEQLNVSEWGEFCLRCQHHVSSYFTS